MRYPLLLAFWVLSDLLLFLALYALAYFVRVGWIFSTDFPLSHLLIAAALAAPFWLGVLFVTRTFALTRRQASLRNFVYIAYAGFVGVALFTLAYYFTFEQFFSRLLLVAAFLFTAVGIWIWHVAFDHVKRLILRRDPPAFPTLIVGITRESTALIRDLNRCRSALKPVAILDVNGSKETAIEGVPVAGRLHKLEEILVSKKITHLIQCNDLEQSMNLLSACRSRGITYMLLPSVLGIVERDERVEALEGRPVTIVSPKRTMFAWAFE